MIEKFVLSAIIIQFTNSWFKSAHTAHPTTTSNLFAKIIALNTNFSIISLYLSISFYFTMENSGTKASNPLTILNVLINKKVYSSKNLHHLILSNTQISNTIFLFHSCNWDTLLIYQIKLNILNYIFIQQKKQL